MIDSLDDASFSDAVARRGAARSEEVRFARAGGAPDAVQSYLTQITRIRRITREEEANLVARLRAGESALSDALKGMGFAMQHYASVAEDIIGGHERLDRFVMERHIANRDEFPTLLRSLCGRLREGIEACDSRYADVMQASQPNLAAAGETFEESLACVQSLVPAFCFKQRVNSDLVPVLADLADELSALEERLRAMPDQAESLRDLQEFERRAWMGPEEFRQRVAEVQRADAESNAAKLALVEAHLWLVVLLARNYTCQGMSFLDLVQEGNLGLMHAAEMYESEGGCRFGSYASWWIRQAITRGIADQARLIRLPVYLSATAGTMLRVQRQLVVDMGREPSVDEMAEELHMPADRVRSILGALQQPLSLQSKFGEGDDAMELGELIEDVNAAAPDEGPGLRLMAGKLDEVLEALSEQERLVMTQRYGLADSTSRSMREVGRQINLCPQRIQQIEAKALKKLRHPVRLRMLNRLLGRGLC